MSYNPRVHTAGGPVSRKPRRIFDPRAGIKHSTLVNKRGPVGASAADAMNRVATPSGWRILYFEGDTFEVYYELLCARNASGILRHPTKDRVVRVLAGQLFITSNGNIESVLLNQVCSLPSNTEYELASSGDSDVELFIIQGRDYETDVERLTAASATNGRSSFIPSKIAPEVARVSADKAELEAARIRDERMVQERRKHQRSPVPKKLNEALPGSATPPSQQPPLPGQQVVGVNLRPMGARGFGDE
jgi:mannose-6-phosphate isomerase-like protein (cupin superfamily)